MSPGRATAALIGVTAAIRLAVAAATGLGVDESFMVGNGRELAASYVDHPPLHVWLVGAWTAAWGSEAAGVARIPFVALFAGSTALMYRLTASLFGERAGLWAAVALNLAPVFTLSTGTWILPDGPLVFFELAAAVVVAPLLVAAAGVRSGPRGPPPASGGSAHPAPLDPASVLLDPTPRDPELRDATPPDAEPAPRDPAPRDPEPALRRAARVRGAPARRDPEWDVSAGAPGGPRRRWTWGEPARWATAGVLLGLALLAKYHAAFLLVAGFVFLATYPRGRRTLRTPGPWLAAGVALALFAPVLGWNAQHEWAGLRFQADRLARPDLQPLRLVGNAAGQAAYLTPWLAAGLALVLVRALRRGPADPRTWSLALAAAGPIGFFTAASLVARGFPHWPMPGWLFVFPLLGAWCAQEPPESGRSRVLRGVAAGSGALLLVLVGALATHAATGWLSGLAPSFSGRADPTVDLVDWVELPVALRERGLLGAQPVVAATHWTEAAKASYALGPAVPVLCLCPGTDQFDLRAGAAGHEGQDVLIVGTERWLAARDPRRWFERVEVLAPVPVTRGGREVLTLQVWRGVGLKPGDR